jgi:hypothetical protein
LIPVFRIEQITAQHHRLKRLQFGCSSEKLDREIEQMELLLNDLQESGAAFPVAVSSPGTPQKPVRWPLPEHPPRERITHAAACTCPRCGGELRLLGEDVTEPLEYVPASFKAVRNVQPKFSCRTCEATAQAPLPIERDLPGPGLL